MHVVILITAPNAEVAHRLARTLVEERLAACVNIVPAVTSIYRWQGRLNEEPETLLIVKSTQANFDALSARIHQLHPYTTPEVIALPITAGAAPYLAWLTTETNPA